MKPILTLLCALLCGCVPPTFVTPKTRTILPANAASVKIHDGDTSIDIVGMDAKALAKAYMDAAQKMLNSAGLPMVISALK